MHTDDFYHYHCQWGRSRPIARIPGSEPGGDGSHGASRSRLAQAGYDVVVDGIVGPWFLGPWQAAADKGLAVHYMVLRASKAETERRALHRAKLDPERNLELVETMWAQFCG